MADSGKTGTTITSADFLIRGKDYLDRKPGFKLVGRSEELTAVSTVLMRRDNNNMVIYGANGVGTSSIILGLQASKDDVNTPFDIVSKRFYFLDVDALFSSGDVSKINEGFQKALATLSRAPDTVLVIEDVKDFLDGCKNNGTTNLINGLMRELRNKKFQAIFEAREENLADLFKSHSDVAEIFTFQGVEEPKKEDLKAIVQSAVPALEEFHGVSISQGAIDTALALTAKYPGLTLNTAQPKRTCVLLEGALTEFRHRAHTHPLEVDVLQERLDVVNSMLVKGAAAGKSLPELEGKSAEELAAIQAETEAQIVTVKAGWEGRQKDIRRVYSNQRDAEEQIRSLEEQIETQKEKDAFMRDLQEQYSAAANDEAKQREIKKQFFDRYGEALPTVDDAKASTGFVNRLKKSGGESEIITALRKQKGEFEKAARESAESFKQLTRGSEKLVLGGEHILAEFSRLSNIPMNKLQQDETIKLLNLENTLMERVYGQNEPVIEVSKAVRRGRTGLKKANKPIGSFLFLGPSGVGKTELAKALAAALFGDEAALETYNMSEYMEKHAVSSLIGAPPGYDGYDAGGVLTNNMRRRPYVVNVFDEAEKAHKEVFDIFLQILDEGKLKDRRGIECSFANAINILTSNIGAEYFLDEGLDFEEAKKKALKDLWDPNVGGFRPEFLNRFTGIFCFNRLGQPEIMLIAGKAFKELNSWIAEKGVRVEMDKDEMAQMCEAQYIPRAGGRGIMNYIERNVTSDVADTLLRNPEQPGIVKVVYDEAQDKALTEFVPAGAEVQTPVVLPANQNADVVAVPAARAAAKTAFRTKKR